ncbi:MAG: radical SAM protein [Verrucomicrobia bacterium]|nr:radical SAM protein [Verrucomicrobiota bacterium]
MKTFAPQFDLTDKLLKRTTSRCPTCHAPCPAEVWRTSGIPSKVFLKRTCPQHGEARVCIASDARFYWLAKGKAENGCCSANRSAPVPGAATSKVEPTLGFPNAPLQSDVAAPGDGRTPKSFACCSADGSSSGTLGRNAEPGDALGVMEKLATCLCLIEIVNSCNLACPTCYADSPVGSGGMDAVPLDDLKRRIQGVIDRKGGIEILQLSGGEPTLHPQFFELLRWLHANPGIDYVLLNTNGVRIANDDSFAEELARTFRYGKFQLYLQFDGTQEAGQQFLRGADLRTTRERSLGRCREMKLPVTLAMTVTPDNLPNLWEAIEFGLRWPNVRGIAFQPMFGSGRTPVQSRVQSPESKVTDNSSRTTANHSGLWTVGSGLRRLNTADIILSAVAQSNGKLRFEDFTPLPCGDPNCATIGYLLKVPGCKLQVGKHDALTTSEPATFNQQPATTEVRSVSDFIDFTRVQDFLGTKVRYKLEDLMKCGCESEPLGDLLKQFELDESHTFRLFIKPFMDAATWDEDRIDRCCTHVIMPDGKLDSFCRYYSRFEDLKSI